MRKLLIIAILISMFGAVGHAPVRADEQQDIKDATDRAEEIFALTDQKKYNAMYDLIHPDAHAVVPRSWRSTPLRSSMRWPKRARPKVTGVEMGPWTWGVTGKTYDNAAAVSFEQPYQGERAGKVLKDTMYLVKADDGEWRWFFGGTKEFVDWPSRPLGTRPTEATTPLTQGDSSTTRSTISTPFTGTPSAIPT